MHLDELHLWYLQDPATPRYIGALKLVTAGKGVSLHYGRHWLDSGFALSEDLPLADIDYLPPGRLEAAMQRAVGAVDDARPDRWGEKVIRFVDKPRRLSMMEYLYYAGDDRFGALGVSTSAETYLPRPGGPLPRLQDAQLLSEAAAKIEAAEALTEMEARIIAGGGSPLGGAKPKALIDINAHHDRSPVRRGFTMWPDPVRFNFNAKKALRSAFFASGYRSSRHHDPQNV